ncbi:MAG: iron-sulfur cluster assembly scaffold protein [bacterium]|nr:iron-sulfur cluster assembly scaffold protein [bacterium]
MNLYQDEILDHYKNPHNKKRLESPSKSCELSNPLCGDRLGLEVVIRDGVIVEVGYWGDGCAISQASMSMLTQELVGLKINESQKIDEKYILELIGVPISASRQKCALLSLSIFKKLIN